MSRIFKAVRWTACCLLLLPLLLSTARAGEEDGFLWQVRSDSARVFLFGSIHMARPDFYPLPESVERAFRLAEVLVVEANINKMNMEDVQAWMRAHALYPPGEPGLKAALSRRSRAKAAALGLDLTPYQNMHPWLAALVLQNQKMNSLGFDEKYGLDKYFLYSAAREEKPVLELESVYYQFNIFRELSTEDQDLFFYHTLLELTDMEKLLQDLVRAWREGRAELFAELFFQDYERHPDLDQLADRLIYSRNKKMLAQILGFLGTEKTYFVVVGAGHLIGEKGLIAGLREQGYQVIKGGPALGKTDSGEPAAAGVRSD